MVKEYVRTVDPPSRRADRLAHIPGPRFVAAWAALVGEPPAMMLASRSEMIQILVDSTPILPLGAGKPPESTPGGTGE